MKDLILLYGITKPFKGRYFDIAKGHIKYIYAIEYPQHFYTFLAGKFGTIKSNNMRIFRKLKIIYKLQFDPKSQYKTKFNHIHTIKSILRSTKELDYIGLNIIKYVKTEPVKHQRKKFLELVHYHGTCSQRILCYSNS